VYVKKSAWSGSPSRDPTRAPAAGQAAAGALAQRLVVRLALDPVAFLAVSDQVLSGLVVDKDEQREWHGD